jgi:WD40 repeat protein
MTDHAGGLAFSPTNANALAVADVTSVDLWNVSNQTVHGYGVPDGGIPVDVAYTPDGKTVAEADSKGEVCLLDVASGQWSGRHFAAPAPAALDQVAVSPDGATLAAVGDAGNVYVWNLSSGKRSDITGAIGNDMFQIVAFSPAGKTLAVASPAGVRLWDVAARAFSGQPLAVPGASPQAVAFSPNGATLAVAAGNGHIYLWNLSTRKTVTLAAPGADWGGLAFSPNGRTLAAYDAYPNEDGKIYLYSVKYASS